MRATNAQRSVGQPQTPNALTLVLDSVIPPSSRPSSWVANWRILEAEPPCGVGLEVGGRLFPKIVWRFDRRTKSDLRRTTRLSRRPRGGSVADGRQRAEGATAEARRWALRVAADVGRRSRRGGYRWH